MKGRFVCGTAILLASGLWLCGVPPGWAASQAPQELTLELLKDRVEHLVQREGKLTVDLHQMTIDLSTENAAFQSQFYRLLQTRLQSGETNVNLDWSESIVLGDIDFQQLSLREPLYGEALSRCTQPITV